MKINFHPLTKVFCYCLLGVFFSAIAHGQDSNAVKKEGFFSNAAMSSKFYYGFLWAHRMGMENLVTGHTTGFELTLVKQTDGSKLWQEIYEYPQTGFSFIHLDLSNQYVGEANAVVAFIQFPCVTNPNLLCSFRLAEGLGYVSTPFDRVENHKNLTASTHINAAIQVMADTRFKISKTLFFNLSYGITHFSNGSFKVPNLGINNISLNGGLTYQFSKPDTFYKPKIPDLDRHWLFDLAYGFGVKENIQFISEQYFAHSFYFSFLKPVSHKSMLGIGGDVFYDLSLIQFLDPAITTDISTKIIRGGAHVSYELVINKLTVLLHMGVYVVDRLNLDGSFYHRIGLKYQVGKHLFANLTLKSHFARADYVELGAGWRIWPHP